MGSSALRSVFAQQVNVRTQIRRFPVKCLARNRGPSLIALDHPVAAAGKLEQQMKHFGSTADVCDLHTCRGHISILLDLDQQVHESSAIIQANRGSFIMTCHDRKKTLADLIDKAGQLE